jgi:hypothetical protein
MMKGTALVLAALLIVSIFAGDAEAGRRKHGKRGGGGCCGCQVEVTDSGATIALPSQ